MDLFWAKIIFGSGLFNVFPTFLDLSQFPHACLVKRTPLHLVGILPLETMLDYKTMR